jgi:hypothetical protein
MIYLQKGQKLFDNDSMVVFDQAGYYNDGDPVICASADDPDQPVCRYEAKFIAYGSAVYSVSDTEKLTEEILKMDPNSLFGKDSQEVATDKLVEQIIPQESGEVVPSATVDEVVTDISSPLIDPGQQSAATSTPSVINTPPSTATTTPEVLNPISIIDNQTSTTTPGVIDPILPINNQTPTTTPEVIEIISPTSTTTPVVDLNASSTSAQGGV